MNTGPAEFADPAELAQLLPFLPPEEQAELYGLLERLIGGESPYEFVARLRPREPIPKHAAFLVRAILRARVMPIRLCISMPPGHAKTTILLRLAVWWMLRSPADTCAYVTYSDTQARDKSKEARDLANESDLELAEDADNLGLWRTPLGGGFLASGFGGRLTGQRIPGILLVDDPYKNAADANSATVREKIYTDFKAAAFTRLQGGSIIVLHTRWHPDDLIGRLVKEHKWECINLAAIAEEGDPLGRAPGEPLWPEQYPKERCKGPCGHAQHLDEIKETLGEWLWAALYQGRPRPKGTKVFHTPSRFLLSSFSWEGKRGVVSVDPATTAKTRADHSVILVGAMEGSGTDSRLWILGVVRLQVETPDLVRRIRAVNRHYQLPVIVEAVSGFKGVPQTLRDVSNSLPEEDGEPTQPMRVTDINPVGDKFLRAQPVAAACNADPSRLMVPTGDPSTGEVAPPWAAEYLEELDSFTGIGDLEDDQVDATAHAWTFLFREGMGIDVGEVGTLSIPDAE